MLLLLNIPLWVSQQPLHGASSESRLFSFFIMGEFIYAENTVFTRLPAGQYNKRFIPNSISLKFHHRRQSFLLCCVVFFPPSAAMKVSALSSFLQSIIPNVLCHLLSTEFFSSLQSFLIFDTILSFLFCFSSPVLQSKEISKVTAYEHSNSEVTPAVCRKISRK